MKRSFSKRQRKILAFEAGGACKICGLRFDNNFHADHIIPFSKGGETVTKNGQALCRECNLKKGAK